MASSNLSMLNTTCKMPDVEIHHILSISFLYWDGKGVKWVKCEGNKPLSCGWNWTSQESSMYFKFEKSWIPWIEPAEKRICNLWITSPGRHYVVATHPWQQPKHLSPLFDSYNHNKILNNELLTTHCQNLALSLPNSPYYQAVRPGFKFRLFFFSLFSHKSLSGL